MNPKYHKSLPKDMRALATWIAQADYPDDEKMPLDLNRPSAYVRKQERADVISALAVKDCSVGVEIY